MSWVLQCPQALYFLFPNIVSWKFLQNTVALEKFNYGTYPLKSI